jgi:hypothetical protein
VILFFTGIRFPEYADKLDTYLQPAMLEEIAFML